jgi:small subunit ribosomal protein S13
VAKKEIKAEEVVRIAGMDLDGNRYVYMALLGIKGIGYNLARALVRVLKIDEKKKLKELSEAELKKLEDAVKHPWNYGIPAWMLNRRKDRETSKDLHLIGVDLTMQINEDIERLKRIKSYRGVKHELGLPVRGQRTRSTFRKGQTVGVSRKKK